VARTPGGFNVRSPKLWRATTEEDPCLEARDGPGNGSKGTGPRGTMARRGGDKDRAGDSGEDEDKDRGENVNIYSSR
jgi:hypothetical protein